ncbi:ABC transporter ATP-binding protein [Kribbella sp. NPDC056861]|uniref:ABC transporter ATP-binding protein n=1 Tax=Kribbella sp. NPDC056861 TaxID=3154857 RepID=UPI0034129352
MKEQPFRVAGLVQVLRLVWLGGPAIVVAYLVFTILGGLEPVVLSWLTKLLLDGIAGGRMESGTAVLLGLGLGVAGIALTVLPSCVRYVSDQLERAVALVADDQLYAAVNKFVGLGRFEDPEFLDKLGLARNAGGVAPGRVLSAMLTLVRSGLTVAGFLVSLLAISPVMALAVSASAVPMAIAEFRLSRQRVRMYQQIEPVLRREFFFSALLTTVEAAKEVRLFGTGQYFRRRMRAERVTANAAERRTARSELLTQGSLGLMSALVAGAGLLWAVRSAAAGNLSVGDLTLFVAAVGGVQLALGSLVTELSGAHHQLMMFEHYRAVVGAGPDLPVEPVPRSLPVLARGIEFEDVWFRYSPSHPWILRGVDLAIPYGGSVGLVGLNGAGKSTLVKLLCRYYDPERGAIRWDGRDLREIDPAELRRRIGAVFQDYMTYDLTAAENVGLGDIDAVDTRARIVAAAHRAGAHELLDDLPNGYDTLLSRVFVDQAEKSAQAAGVHLSGGQWQRVALARAMLRDHCDLMILDEPASGLDAEAEHELHQRLQQHRAGRTSVLISHRLGSLREADRIVVLESGQVMEQGSHDELMMLDGAYARLFRLQAKGYHLDELVGQ